MLLLEKIAILSKQSSFLFHRTRRQCHNLLEHTRRATLDICSRLMFLRIDELADIDDFFQHRILSTFPLDLIHESGVELSRQHQFSLLKRAEEMSTACNITLVSASSWSQGSSLLLLIS